MLEFTAAGVGSSYGYRAGFAYGAGLWAGNLLVGGLVISGIAAVVLGGALAVRAAAVGSGRPTAASATHRRDRP